MSIITDTAENCNCNSTANNTAVPETAPERSGFKSGGEEEKKPVREWDAFSRDFAFKMNPRQPDVVAALLFDHVCFRLTNPPAYCFKDGKAWYFRGADELVNEEFPYLTTDEVYGAIKRLEAKGHIEIAPAGKYSSTQWYHIPQKARKAHASTPKVWFRQDEAIRFGVRKALLLGNLHWEFDHWKKFETDSAGNKYGILSPTALSKRDEKQPVPALPMSRDTITKLLKELCEEDHALVAHPKKKTYYTFASSFILKTPCDASLLPHRDVGDHDPVVGVHESIVGDHDPNVGVHDSSCPEKDSNSLPDNAFCNNASGVNRNITSKEDRKGNRKDNSLSLPAPAPPLQEHCLNDKLSSNAKKLMMLINEGMKESRQRDFSPIATKVTPDQLPYDDIGKLDQELPYDIIIPRTVEIGNAVKWIKQYWRTYKVRYTKEDVADLSRLLCANPSLTLKDWQTIEYAIGTAQLDHHWFEQVDYSEGVLARVRTAKDRLHYLPQIISQMHVSQEYDEIMGGDDIVISGTIPEPYRSLDFSVLEDVAEGDLWRIVPPPLKFVTHEVNPIAAM